MIQYHDFNYRDESMVTEKISAEDQCWDKETLTQLEQEHNVIYNGGIMPVKVISIPNGRPPLIALGFEDDGTVFFERYDTYKEDEVAGGYRHCFSASWLDSVITQLQEVRKKIG